MFGQRITRIFGIAAVLAVGVVAQASADPVLGIKLEEPGYASFTTTGSSDPLIAVQNFGTFALNVVVNTLATNPLALDLGSTNVSSAAAGTLTILASATGLTSPLGLVDILSQFSGNFVGDVISATFQTYVSNSNTMFGTDTLLASQSANGTPFSTSSTNSTTTNAPFAITEVMTIKTAGLAILSLDGSASAAHAVPEIDAKSGAAAIALLLGVLGLIGERRRKPNVAA